MAGVVCPDRVLRSLDVVLDEVEALICAVRPDQLDDPTPCDRWRVRDLLNHLVLVNLLYGAQVQGRPAPDADADLIDGDHARAFTDSAALARAAFGRPGMLAAPCPSRWGPVPGYVIVQHVVNELIAHGWDLAKATGRCTDLAPEVATESLAAWEACLGARRWACGTLFAPPRPAPEGAYAADRLAAYLGREL